MVFNAAHIAAPIIDAVAGRNVVAAVCPHGHNDQVNVAPELGEALDDLVLLHPAHNMLWRMTLPDSRFRGLDDDKSLQAGSVRVSALHTPGHSQGSVCWHAPTSERCSASTPCSTVGWAPPAGSFLDFPTILKSIKGCIGMLPNDTAFYTGHGDTTTVSGKLVYCDDWVVHGH